MSLSNMMSVFTETAMLGKVPPGSVRPGHHGLPGPGRDVYLRPLWPTRHLQLLFSNTAYVPTRCLQNKETTLYLSPSCVQG